MLKEGERGKGGGRESDVTRGKKKLTDGKVECNEPGNGESDEAKEGATAY